MGEYYRFKIINGTCLAHTSSEFSAFVSLRQQRRIKRCVLNCNKLLLVTDMAMRRTHLTRFNAMSVMLIMGI
jgi:hypothetical protein